MDLPGLDRRRGRVVEAEIFRRYNSPGSFDLRHSSRPFFLVLSVGRCKFRLSESSVALTIHSVNGGQPDAFQVLPLGDRVFSFSVVSQQVGFHIYRLRAFECHNFKIFFHLWHSGGPKFWHEYRLWLDEQSCEWMEVTKNPSKSANLSRANLVQLGTRRVLRPQVQNSNVFIPGRQSVFKRIKPA